MMTYLLMIACLPTNVQYLQCACFHCVLLMCYVLFSNKLLDHIVGELSCACVYNHHNVFITFHIIYLLVKCFLVLISLSYLFVLAHPLGVVTPLRDVLPLSLEIDGCPLLLLYIHNIVFCD